MINGYVSLPIFTILLTICGFFITFSVSEFVLPMLRKQGVVDTATGRSSHTGTTVRGVGIAIVASFACSWIVAFMSVQSIMSKTTITIVVGALVGALIGIFEDMRGLSVLARSVVLFTLSMTVAVILSLIQGFSPLSVLFVLYGSLFISGYINVANFMDGLNGISGFHGIVAGLGFACLGWFTNTAWVFVGGMILTAVFAGFLPVNLRGRAFMGDSGSYFLGAAVAIMSISLLVVGFPFLSTIGPMVIYFGDVAVTMVSRLRRKESIAEPHKEHTYQRIQQRGYSHLQASGMTAIASMITTGLGVAVLWMQDLLSQLLLFSGGLITLLVYLALPKILPNKCK